MATYTHSFRHFPILVSYLSYTENVYPLQMRKDVIISNRKYKHFDNEWKKVQYILRFSVRKWRYLASENFYRQSSLVYYMIIQLTHNDCIIYYSNGNHTKSYMYVHIIWDIFILSENWKLLKTLTWDLSQIPNTYIKNVYIAIWPKEQ